MIRLYNRKTKDVVGDFFNMVDLKKYSRKYGHLRIVGEKEIWVAAEYEEFSGYGRNILPDRTLSDISLKEEVFWGRENGKRNAY